MPSGSMRSAKSLLKLSCQLLHTSAQKPKEVSAEGSRKAARRNTTCGLDVQILRRPVLCNKVWDVLWDAFSAQPALGGQWCLPDIAPWNRGSPSPASPSLLGTKGNPACSEFSKSRPCWGCRTCRGPPPSQHLAPRRAQSGTYTYILLHV